MANAREKSAIVSMAAAVPLLTAAFAVRSAACLAACR